MDTALFYPVHMDLKPNEARRQIGHIIDSTVQFGGAITLNWHDRSIAAERHWGDFYSDLVRELESRGAWLATAAETVSWFRKRRAATFESSDYWPDRFNVRIADDGAALPALRLQIENVAVWPLSSQDTSVHTAQ
jgi:hypothetical protein